MANRLTDSTINMTRSKVEVDNRRGRVLNVTSGPRSNRQSNFTTQQNRPPRGENITREPRRIATGSPNRVNRTLKPR